MDILRLKMSIFRRDLGLIFCPPLVWKISKYFLDPLYGKSGQNGTLGAAHTPYKPMGVPPGICIGFVAYNFQNVFSW